MIEVATARREVLQAFHRLEARTGDRAFPLKEIVGEVLSSTSAFTESTIRTYVVSVMCADAPVHHANHTNDVRRVARGVYALAVHGDASLRPSVPATPEVAPHREISVAGASPWHWEGNVQASIVEGLVAAGWRVQAVSDTESRSPGTDIIATRDGRRLHVEVKGYPTTTYARGEKKGERKPTAPATQARVWMAGALLKAAMLRDDYPDDLVAIGLPVFDTYRALVDRTRLTFQLSGIGLVWVHKDGGVDIQLATGG